MIQNERLASRITYFFHPLVRQNKITKSAFDRRARADFHMWSCCFLHYDRHAHVLIFEIKYLAYGAIT